MSFRIEDKFFLHSQNLDKLKLWIKLQKGKVMYPKRYITSLYFDTENNKSLIDSEEGIVPRKKIRFRSYDNLLNFKKEIFFEKKITSVEGKYKISEKINEYKLNNYLKNGIIVSDHGIVFPKIYVTYLRYYYVIKDLKINIDMNIKYRRFKFNDIDSLSINDNDIVLEIKAPMDINFKNIIDTLPFNLRRFSKYSRGILYINNQNRYLIKN